MLDLHCHILPGVDDGAVDVSDAVAMARAAIEQGCEAVVASSHLFEGLFDTSPELLERELPVLRRALLREGVALEVFAGAENYLAPGVPADAFAERAVGIGDNGRWVLFDFSLREPPPHVGETVDALAERGRGAVIAHPERCLALASDPTPVADWIARGALIQVNASSLLGYLGPDAQGAAEYLLEKGAAHVLASDAHGVQRRPFCLGDGYAAATRLVGGEAARALCSHHPWAIARGEDVGTGPVELEPRSRTARFLRRLRGGES